MSKRKSRPNQTSRGPSRPVSTRYYSSGRGAPGRRPDTFLIWLVGISTALVVLLVFFLTTANRGATTGTPTSTTYELPTANGALPTPNGPAWTATAIAFATEVAPLPRISAEELKTLVAANNVKIIDVRVKKDYDVQHIKGSTNVPQSDFLIRAKEFPKEGNLVLYCKCPNDEESDGVALALIDKAGYTNVRVLKGGLVAWMTAGGATEP